MLGSLQCLSAFLYESPTVRLLQYHALVPGLLLGSLWLLTAFIRSREYLRKRRSFDTTTKYPPVTVVLPTKGVRTHSLQNWQSFLDLKYNGDVEFLFIVESERDAAIRILKQSLRPGRCKMHVITAGQTTRCSQKIHNLIAGIRAAHSASKYILCLDDDIHLHPTTLQNFVFDMEQNPSIFMCTGYPFDIPPRGATLATYCTLAYHLPLVIAFSLRQHTQFVWGGCMLFRKEGLEADIPRNGILEAWGQGGYSDDLTVASACTEFGLHIHCPSYALFPQWMECALTMRQWWNYLRRQLFVLDTYPNEQCRRTHHCMALLHVYGSLAFVLPVVTVCVQSVLTCMILVFVDREEDNSVKLHPSYYVALGSLAFMFFGLFWMTHVATGLLRHLNPSISYKQVHTLSWAKVICGMWLSNCVTPFCMGYTFWRPHIEWSDVTYYKMRGKIIKVLSSDE